ncbi:phosphate signaling complex protein PhoU [Halobacteriaceae archaeon GCM10025711]
MPREQYVEQLDDLREDVLALGDLVLERLRQALDALKHHDERLASEVVAGDGEINRIYLALEQECIDLFALQQPVAGDLRFVAASFKILTDLERIGDLATNLAGYAVDADRERVPGVDVEELGRSTVEMVEDALDAYADADIDACYAVAARDDEVDAACERASEAVVRHLIDVDLDADEAATASLLGDASRLLLTVRDLERVGDHAVNVCARTVYMAENDDALIF